MKNIVVLVSGGGTNLQALIDASERGEIKGVKSPVLFLQIRMLMHLREPRITILLPI